MKRLSDVLMAALLFTASISGCFSQGPGPDLFIGTVHHGDEFHYESSSGISIKIEVGPTGVARDRSLTAKESVLLFMTIFRPDIPEYKEHVEEALALEGGSIVRQVRTCEWPSTDISSECGEQARIYYMAGGFPGGLGGAPFWHSGAIPADGGQILVHAPFASMASIDFETSVTNDDCASVKRVETESSAWTGAWHPTTVLYDSTTFCRGIPLPVEWRPSGDFKFSPEDRPLFKLTSWTRGADGPVGMHATSGPNIAGEPLFVSATSLERPLVPNDADYVPFSSEDAFERAKSLDATFSDMVNAGAILVYNELLTGGVSKCCAVPVYERHTSARVLGLQLGSGETYMVQVGRTDTVEPATDPASPRYSIMDSWTDRRAQIPTGAADRPSATAEAILSFAADAWQSRLVGTTYEYGIPNGDPNTRVGSPLGLLAITVGYGPGLERSGTATAFLLRVDASSGTLMRMDVTPEMVADFA